MVADTTGHSKMCQNLSHDEILKLRSRWQQQGVVFLTVGRLIPLKGFQELIQSWAMFSQKYPGNSLVIVGTGSEESKLKYLSRSLDLNNIYFEGAVDMTI